MMNKKSEIKVQHFFDPDTFTLTYVVYDSVVRDAVIIDPVLDFDPPSGKVEDNSIRKVIDFINAESLKVHAVLETHAHADHLSSSQILKQVFPQVKLGIGEKIKEVQKTFKDVFHIDYLQTNGSQFDFLIKDQEELTFGRLKMKAMATPGHTPACMSYLFDDQFGGHLFSGDALFMPDYGTGRCDFPGGSAKDLYQSVHAGLYSLPDDTKVYVGHDYSPNGRQMLYKTTIGESKKYNIQLKAETSESDFIRFRTGRDATLKAPRLLLPSIQVNIDAGHLPPMEKNEVSYLKLPLVKKLNLGTL